MRFSPSCGCCQCAYVASDGNRYTDDFTSLNANWVGQEFNAVNLLISSGRLQLTVKTTGKTKWNAMQYVPPFTNPISSGTDLLVVIECQVYADANTQFAGVFLSYDNTTFASYVRRFAANFQDGTFEIPGLVVISQTPANGDKLTIKVTETQACYFINDDLVYTIDGATGLPSTFPTQDWYGVWGTPIVDSVNNVIAEFDNFTIHIGNP